MRDTGGGAPPLPIRKKVIIHDHHHPHHHHNPSHHCPHLVRPTIIISVKTSIYWSASGILNSIIHTILGLILIVIIKIIMLIMIISRRWGRAPIGRLQDSSVLATLTSEPRRPVEREILRYSDGDGDGDGEPHVQRQGVVVVDGVVHRQV